jgi:hypothetical protein
MLEPSFLEPFFLSRYFSSRDLGCDSQTLNLEH